MMSCDMCRIGRNVFYARNSYLKLAVSSRSDCVRRLCAARLADPKSSYAQTKGEDVLSCALVG